MQNCDVMSVLKFEIWTVEKNLVPYMLKMVFPNVLVKGWMVDPYRNIFFHSSCKILVLPSSMLKIPMDVPWPVVIW